MKYALIATESYLDVTVELGMGYHFALGQELVRNADYRHFYRKAVRRGGFVIVDNGAAEPEEERVSFETILDVCTDLQVDEVILPDVLYDKEATIEATLKMCYKVPPRKRFVVPQGRTWEEWGTCLRALMVYAKPATIGIPKWLEDLPGGRVRAIDIARTAGATTECNIHLLGVRKHVFEEPYIAAQRFSGIRGIDTAAPLAFAQYERVLTDDEHFSVVWGANAPYSLVFDNTLRMMSWCHNWKHWR